MVFGGACTIWSWVCAYHIIHENHTSSTASNLRPESVVCACIKNPMLYDNIRTFCTTYIVPGVPHSCRKL